MLEAIKLSLLPIGSETIIETEKSPRKVKVVWRFKMGPTLEISVRDWQKNHGLAGPAWGFIENSKTFIIISHGTDYGNLWDSEEIEKLLKEFHNKEYVKNIVIICCHAKKCEKNFLPLWTKDFPKLVFTKNENPLFIITNFDRNATIAEEI